MAAAPDLVHFAPGHNGLPVVQLLSVAHQHRVFSYDVLPANATATDVIRLWWQELIDDLGFRLPHLAHAGEEEGGVQARFAVIFYGPPWRAGPWRSTVMDFDTFSDPVEVEIALEDSRPGSDLDEILVTWLQIEVIEYPDAARRRDMIRGAAKRAQEEKKRRLREAELDADLDLVEQFADFFGDFVGLEDPDEDEDPYEEKPFSPPHSPQSGEFDLPFAREDALDVPQDLYDRMIAQLDALPLSRATQAANRYRQILASRDRAWLEALSIRLLGAPEGDAQHLRDVYHSLITWRLSTLAGDVDWKDEKDEKDEKKGAERPYSPESGEFDLPFGPDDRPADLPDDLYALLMAQLDALPFGTRAGQVADRYRQIITSQDRDWLEGLSARLLGAPVNEATPLRDVYHALITWRLRNLEEGDEKYDEKGNDELDEKHVGAYDQKRIEAARPAQTEEWYRSKHPKLLIQIKNKGNNRCLEYAIAAHRKQTDLRDKSWREKEKSDGKELSAKERVRHAELSKPTQQKFNHYTRGGGGPRSTWTSDAAVIARKVLGDTEAKRDRPRQLGDLVKYHNVLRIKFLVFTFDEHGRNPYPVRASWEIPGADELEENADVISLVWTPPPPDGDTGHFDLIPAGCDLAVAYLGCAPGVTWCRICYQRYPRQTGHKCQMFCPACGQFGCPNRKGRLGNPRRCDTCRRRFWGDACFANHLKPLPPRGARPMMQNIDAAMMEVEVPLEQGPNIKNGFKAKHPRWSMCESLIDCPNCGINTPNKIKVIIDKKTEYVDHKCGWEVCGHCGEFKPKTHECYVKKKEWRDAGSPDSYICVDIECDTRGYHTPYLIRACVGLGDREGKTRNLGGYDEKRNYVGATPAGDYDENGKRVWFWFEGDGCEKKFVAWLLHKRQADKKGFTVIAHNGSGYDYAVMYRAIYLAGDELTRKSVKVIYRGSRLIGVTIGSGDRRITFIDFFLHVDGSLGSMVKTFGLRDELKAAGLSLEKEHFPHLLTDRTYRGRLPPTRFYPRRGNKKEQTAFEQWHAQEQKLFHPYTDKFWDFDEQAREYNHHDVELLRRAAREFRLASMASTRKGDNMGCDPLQYLTTPAACLAVYRWLDLQDTTVPNFTIPLNRIFRRALSGGRVEATQFYWPTRDTPPTEKLYKIDINSLYPAVSVEFKYPIGYPDEYYGRPVPDAWPLGTPNVHDLLEDDDGLDLLGELLDERNFAFLVVDVSAPDDLLSPVLPLKEQGKNKYTLEPKEHYAVNSPMLRRAVQAGYKVTRVYGAALWREEKFPDPSLGIWTTYVKRWMKEKDEASDYPPECKTDEQKRAFLRQYRRWPLNCNNRLDPQHIESNPGRKKVAKLRANNLWGKFTQKECYAETSIFRADQLDEMWELLNDQTHFQVMRLIPLDEFSMEVSYRKKLPDGEEELQSDSCLRFGATPHMVIPGELVPMYGQLKMYEFMDKIGNQRCYMDTDSLIYRYDPQNAEHKFIGGEDVGPFLGQFKDELKEDGKDLTISHFASGGAKNYVLLFANGQPGKSTVKGLPRSKLHPDFQWWFIKASVIAHGLGNPEKAPSAVDVGVTRFLRDGTREGVKTVPWLLKYGLVNDKVELFPDGSTLPIGHHGVQVWRDFFEEHRAEWETELKQALGKVEGLRPTQAEWSGDQDRAEQQKKRRRPQEDEKGEQQPQQQDDDRRDRFNARAVAAGARLRRDYVNEVQMAGDLDEEGLLDMQMAHGFNPDPDLFDGMLGD